MYQKLESKFCLQRFSTGKQDKVTYVYKLVV